MSPNIRRQVGTNEGCKSVRVLRLRVVLSLVDVLGHPDLRLTRRSRRVKRYLPTCEFSQVEVWGVVV